MHSPRLRYAIPTVLLKRLLMGFAAAGASASCEGDPTGIEVTDEREYSDHREIDVAFESDDARLAGTLYLAPGAGPLRPVVHNGGSSWTTREPWAAVGPFVSMIGGIFSYDKRGQGASGGTCCSADDDEAFARLASDWVAAVRAIRTLERVDADRIGIFGSSYSGWTLPLAAALGGPDVAFAIVVVGARYRSDRSTCTTNSRATGRARRAAGPMPRSPTRSSPWAPAASTRRHLSKRSPNPPTGCTAEWISAIQPRFRS